MFRADPRLVKDLSVDGRPQVLLGPAKLALGINLQAPTLSSGGPRSSRRSASVAHLVPRMCIRFDLLDMTLPLKFGIQEAQITADQSLNACHHIIHTAATIQPRCPQPHH